MDTKKKILLVLMLCCTYLLYGCTIHRTPRVEDATYKNFEYEFKFRIPNSWQPHKNMPSTIKKGVAGNFSDDFLVMLTTPNNSGIIIVAAEKSDDDILTLGQNKEAFQEKLLERIKEREEKVTNSFQYENYAYEVGTLSVKEGYAPSFIYQESAQNKTGDKYVRSEYLNICQKDCTCTIRFTLLSKEADFPSNYQIFTKVADSAKKVYQ